MVDFWRDFFCTLPLLLFRNLLVNFLILDSDYCRQGLVKMGSNGDILFQKRRRKGAQVGFSTEY